MVRKGASGEASGVVLVYGVLWGGRREVRCVVVRLVV